MLFEQIQSNKKNSVILIFIFFCIALMVGAAASYYITSNIYTGLILTSVAMAVYIPISIANGKKIILKMNHAKKIENSRQSPHLWNTVENLAMVAHIPMPELYIIEEDSPNAFAAGISPEKACVVVTTALLNKLTREEVEAVVAHEIAHIRNYDIRLTTISLALIAIITIITEFSTRLFIQRDNKNIFLLIISLVIVLIAPILASAMHFALSRNREFLADASGAELCRNPLALASALKKISADTDPIDNISPSSAALYFGEPTKKKKKSSAGLFDTHPPAEERIARLERM